MDNIPDTPEWNGTLWEEELDKAIEQGYIMIKTPDGSKYRITDRNQVIDIPLSNNESKVFNGVVK